jgi:hypothetical protein
MELLLILDTLVDPTSRGIRGASTARHLLFYSEEWDLDLIVSKSTEGISLRGQVLPRGSADLSSLFNAVVVLMQGTSDDLVESTKLTSRGEFEFGDVPESHLRIETFLKAHRLTASFQP